MTEEPKKDSKIELLRKEVNAFKERLDGHKEDIDDLKERVKALEAETW